MTNSLEDGHARTKRAAGNLEPQSIWPPRYTPVSAHLDSEDEKILTDHKARLLVHLTR